MTGLSYKSQLKSLLVIEDMEIGYPNHKRPLYLAASINQIPIKRALVYTDASVNLITLSTLQAAGISKERSRDA